VIISGIIKDQTGANEWPAAISQSDAYGPLFVLQPLKMWKWPCWHVKGCVHILLCERMISSGQHKTQSQQTSYVKQRGI